MEHLVEAGPFDPCMHCVDNGRFCRLDIQSRSGVMFVFYTDYYRNEPEVTLSRVTAELDRSRPRKAVPYDSEIIEPVWAGCAKRHLR